MKKFLVLLLLIVFLALWGFGVILPDAGYVLVILGQKTLETSLWFACFTVISLWVIWWLVSRFVHISWSIAQRVTDFFVFGSMERASKRAASGLIDFLSGDWLQARKKLLRTATKVESPLVNYLAAARASFELGDHEDALKILSDAQQKYQHFVVPIAIAQAKMEMRIGQFDAAKTRLQLLQQKFPKHPLVINALRELFVARQDWVSLADIFPQVKKYKLCAVNDILAMESAIAASQLRAAAELARLAPVADQLSLLRKAWGRLSGQQQRSATAVAAYARALMDNLQDQEAETLLRKSLNKSWSDELAGLYGLLRVADIADAIRTAEGWLKYYPQNPVLLRTLGRLSLRNQLWGLARDYFQRSLAVSKDAETYAELARLLESLGDVQRSMDVYREALALTVPALPDLPQPHKTY